MALKIESVEHNLRWDNFSLERRPECAGNDTSVHVIRGSLTFQLRSNRGRAIFSDMLVPFEKHMWRIIQNKEKWCALGRGAGVLSHRNTTIFLLLGKCLSNSIYKYDGILNLKVKYQGIIKSGHCQPGNTI